MAGHDVTMVDNVDDALKSFDAKSYEVVLTDIMMPAGDAFADRDTFSVRCRFLTIVV